MGPKGYYNTKGVVVMTVYVIRETYDDHEQWAEDSCAYTDVLCNEGGFENQDEAMARSKELANAKIEEFTSDYQRDVACYEDIGEDSEGILAPQLEMVKPREGDLGGWDAYYDDHEYEYRVVPIEIH